MIFINQFSKLFFSFLLMINVSYAENLLYTDLKKMCEFNENSNQLSKENAKNKELDCFYYIFLKKIEHKVRDIHDDR